jgi:hypothetical protein
MVDTLRELLLPFTSSELMALVAQSKRSGAIIQPFLLHPLIFEHLFRISQDAEKSSPLSQISQLDPAEVDCGLRIF